MNNFIKAARHVLRSRMVKQAINIGDKLVRKKVKGKWVYEVIPKEQLPPEPEYHDIDDYLAKKYLFENSDWEKDPKAVKEFNEAPISLDYFSGFKQIPLAPGTGNFNPKLIKALKDFSERNPEAAKNLGILDQDTAWKAGLYTWEDRINALRNSFSGKRPPKDKERQFFTNSAQSFPEEIFTRLQEGKLSTKEKELLSKYMQRVDQQAPGSYSAKEQQRLLADELYGLGEISDRITDDQMMFDGLSRDYSYPKDYADLGRQVIKLYNKKYKDLTGNKVDYVDVFKPDWMYS